MLLHSNDLKFLPVALEYALPDWKFSLFGTYLFYCRPLQSICQNGENQIFCVYQSVLLPPANEVWGKVIFLHQFVILFTGGVRGCWGGMRGFIQGVCVVAPGGHAWLLGGHAWFYLGGHAWFYLGGMRGFIWGVCVVLFRGHAWFYLGGLAWFFQFFRIQ